VRSGHAARRSLKFRLRRTLNWFPVALCYAAFYFARYTLSAMNTPRFRHMMGLTQGELGWVLTSGMWTYALTGTLTGTAADRLGGKRAMLLSAAGAGLANAVLAAWFLYLEYYGEGAGGGGARGAHNASWNMSPLSSSSFSSSSSASSSAAHSASSSSASSFSSASSPSPSSSAHHHSSPFVALAVLYSLSNFFQGFGTSACVKLNAGWYTPRERGIFSGIFNVSITSGFYMALSVSPMVAKSFSWPCVFILPAALLWGSGIMMAIVTRESPALAGAGFGAEYSMHMRVEAAEGAGEGGGEVGRGGEGGTGGQTGGHSYVVRRTAAGKSGGDIDGRYQRVGGDDDDGEGRRGGGGGDDDGESDMEALEIATAPGGRAVGAAGGASSWASSSYSCRGLARRWCGGLSKRLFPPVLGACTHHVIHPSYTLHTPIYNHVYTPMCASKHPL
jgi:MFS family permease